MIILFSTLFQIKISILFDQIFNNKKVGCGGSNSLLNLGLRWEHTRLLACNAHQPFQWNPKSMIIDLSGNHNGSSNRLDRLKRCCHQSHSTLCVHMYDAWFKFKNKAMEKTLVIIWMDASFVWHPYLLGMFQQWIIPHISWRWRDMKHKGKEMIAWSDNCIFSYFDLGWSLNQCSFAVIHIAFS